MTIQLWSKKLEEHLLGTFQYDPLTGHVTRKHWAERGPRTTGPVGTLKPNGEWMLSVLHDGRMWVIKLNKLAMFLHTGKQYARVGWVNGDKSDNRFENLTPLGTPINEGDNIEESKNANIERAQEEHWQRKLALEAEIEQRIAKQKQDKSNRPAKALDPVKAAKRAAQLAELEKKRLSDEGAKRWLEDMDKPWPVDPAHARMEKIEKEETRIEEKYWEHRVKIGIRTGMDYYDLVQFWKDANRLMNEAREPIEFLDEVNKDNPNLNMPEIDPKFDHDRVLAAYLLAWKEKGSFTVVAIDSALKEYTFQKEEYPGKYMELPLEGKMELARFKANLPPIEPAQVDSMVTTDGHVVSLGSDKPTSGEYSQTGSTAFSGGQR